MRALNSHFVLIDLHTSWHSATQIPTSTFDYLKKSTGLPNSLSQAFHRTRPRRRSGISSSTSSVPSNPAPARSAGTGKWVVVGFSVSTTSRSGEVSELDLFLELAPLRMTNELFGHQETGKYNGVREPLRRRSEY